MARRFSLIPAVVGVVLVASWPVSGSELTTSDRVAMLYSPQLQFSTDGDPMIKIALVEGRNEITFTPEGPINVLPLGEGGPEIELPGGFEYRITKTNGDPGTYRYWATVGRALPSERSELAEMRALWESRGYEPHRLNLGSYFAVRGTPFDNRQTLLAVGGLENRDDVVTLANELEALYGLAPELHTELVEFPTGELELSCEQLDINVRHRDLLWITTDDDNAFQISGATFGLDDDSPRRFVGSLIATFDRGGDLILVNDLPAERLLKGIVPAEIYASAPIDALRSQAVAARGELLSDLGVRYVADPYMTCADVRCQVYHGIDAEDSRTSEAVETTRGVVLLDDDHLARTVYSASCGGSLGDYQSTWGQEAIAHLTYHIDSDHPDERYSSGIGEELISEFLSGDVDSFCGIESFGGSRTFRWTVRLNADELTSAVNERYEIGAVSDIEVLSRDLSGRVVALHLVGDRGEITVERELAIRRALGGLRSALFTLDVDRDITGAVENIVVTGGGYGHGVGLCQTGAIGAAQRGLGYVEILSHYYPGTRTAQIWD